MEESKKFGFPVELLDLPMEDSNSMTKTLHLWKVLEKTAPSPGVMAFGKRESGEVLTATLEETGHLLIAGITGAGKSTFLRSLILSMTYTTFPADLRMILMDPRQVEFAPFASLPHLLLPPLSSQRQAIKALHWAKEECEIRYEKFQAAGVSNLARYNKTQCALPRIVIVIDGLEDFIRADGGCITKLLTLLTQKGRAVGIHVILSTQRPTVQVVTGDIQANMTTKMAFAVASSLESRMILDENGAEKLRGCGDCLLRWYRDRGLVHIQAPWVSEEEIQQVKTYFTQQYEPMKPLFSLQEAVQEDELLDDAMNVVLDAGQASISTIQRKLRIGYARAARLVDIMEAKGYVSGFDGSRPRQVLINREQYETFLNRTPVSASQKMETPEKEKEMSEVKTLQPEKKRGLWDIICKR